MTISASVPGCEHAFARVHAEDARGGGGNEFDETVDGDFARVDAVMPDELKTILDAGSAVGNFGEVVFAEDFLVGEAEGAVVGGDDLEMIVTQAVPEFGEIVLFAQGRGEDVFGAFEVGALQFFDGEKKILRAGFGEGGETAVARFADLVERVFGREVDDVDGRSGHFGERDGAVDGFGFGSCGTGERVIDGRSFAVCEQRAGRSRR